MMAERNPALHQWFTPAWAAQEIVAKEFSWLGRGHAALEPACGDGAFLCAIPEQTLAIGVEIDPAQAALARSASGRQVIEGDFLLADLPAGKFDAVIGNPPFEARLVASFLGRAHQLLREGGEVGFILPAYIFQTSSKVEQYSRQFSIRQSLLPRNLFPGLRLPLVFAKFIKEQHRKLYGFLLYRETQEVGALDPRARKELSEGRGSRNVWAPVVERVLDELGGEAELEDIYRAIAGRRPTQNQHWQAKVRQVVQRHGAFVRTGAARYAKASFAGRRSAQEACA